MNINYPGNIAPSIIHIVNSIHIAPLLSWRIAFGIYTFFLFVIVWRNKQTLENTKTPSTGFSYKYLAVAIIGIIILRLPNLVLYEQNLDESQWIANAATFYSGAILWKTVSGYTGGPLLYAPLTIMNLLGEGLNYASIRLFGLLFCIIPSFILMYYTFRLKCSERIAAMVTIPLAIFFASVCSYDMIAYNSEHVPMLFISAAMYLLFYLHTHVRIKSTTIFIAGIILGLFPYAKLQSIPIATIIGLCIIIELLCKKGIEIKIRISQISLLIIGSILPTIITFIYLLRYNAVNDFWGKYIADNILYVNRGLGTTIHGREKWTLAIAIIRYSSDSYTYIVLLVGILIVSTAWLFLHRSFKKLATEKRLFIYLILISLFSYISICIPGNYFHHYLLLGIIPFSYISAYIFCNALSINASVRYTKPILILFALLVITLSGIRILMNGNLGMQAIQYKKYKKSNGVTELIKKYSKPNERMSLWGWGDKYYVETGLIQANIDAHPYYEIMDPEDKKTLELYLQEMQLNKPIVFLDMVSSKAFVFKHPEKQRHENYPLLNNYILQNYSLVGEVDSNRVYVLNTRIKQLQ